MHRYIHLLNGKPAYFHTDQVVYWYTSSNRPCPTRATLREIRAEQRRSAEWRAAQGFGMHSTYGHARIALGGATRPSTVSPVRGRRGGARVRVGRRTPRS